MDVQCFPGNFCTDFPLKVKYGDFHKIYITIPKQSLDIYILHPSVTCCHVSPIFVCIRYLHLPVRSIFQICTFPRYVIRVINNPEWITIFISRKLPQYGSVCCLKLYNKVWTWNQHVSVSERCKIKKNMDSTFENRRILAKSVHKTLWETFREGSVCCQSRCSGAIGFQSKANILIQGAVPSIFYHSNPKTKLGSHGKRLSESPILMYKVFKRKCPEKMFKP